MNASLQECIFKYRQIAFQKGANVVFSENKTDKAPNGGKMPALSIPLYNLKKSNGEEYALRDKHIQGEIIATFTFSSSKEVVGVFTDFAFYYFCDKVYKFEIPYSEIGGAWLSESSFYDIDISYRTDTKKTTTLSGLLGIHRTQFCNSEI